jgi:phage terminase Nu1 subunit (DNA packaging protein)
MFDIEAPVTSAQLAKLLGISQRRIQMLQAAGLLSAYPGAKGLNAVLSIKKYCAHLREQAAGRGTAPGDSTKRQSGAFDVRWETAKLKSSQRRLVNLKARILEGSAIPVEAIRPAWERVARAVQGAVMAAPGVIRGKLPHLTPFDEQTIDQVLRDLLTDAEMTLEPPKLGGDHDLEAVNGPVAE